MTAYKGEKQWAPCYHGEGAEEKTVEFVQMVLAKGDDPENPHYANPKGDLETMLWALGLAWYDGSIPVEIKWGFYADQWVGVSVEIISGEGEEKVTECLWTVADNFTMAVAKTIERLKDKGYWNKPPTDPDDDVTT